MSVGSIYGTSNRITGLASGLDTDSVIKNMMAREQAKLDKMNQNKQIMLWKQDLYRGVINDIKGFQNKYFDVLSKDYILSTKNLYSFDVNFKDNLKSLRISANENAAEGDYTVKMLEKATEAKYVGGTTNKMTASANNFPIKIDNSNKTLSVNGKDLELEAKTYNSVTEMKDEINKKLAASTLDEHKGIKAVVKDGKIQFNKAMEVKAEDKFTFDVTDKDGNSQKFEFQLKAENYTIDEIQSQISSQLKDKKITIDGKETALNEVVKLNVSADGKSIEFKGISDDTITGTVNKNGAKFEVADLNIVGKESNTGTDYVSSGNTLSFKKEIIAGLNDELKVNIDGTEYTLKIPEEDYTNGEGKVDNARLADSLQNQIVDNRIIDKLSISVSGDKLLIESKTASTIKFSGNAVTTLGIKENSEMNLNKKEKVSDIFGVSEKVTFTINDVKFEYDFSEKGAHKDMTIEKFMTDVADKAKVEFAYSDLSKKFTLKSKETGANQEIKVKDGDGGLLGKIFGTTPDNTKGTSAKVEITNPDGEKNIVIKDSNNFTIDGVNYDVVSMKANEEVSFTISKNTEAMFDKIVGFVDEYNKIIENINGLLTEKNDRSYKPLTEEQKKDMSEKEIELWEKKTKEGLLQGDSLLSGIKDSLRNIWTQPVLDSKISFGKRTIGIDTSTDFKDGGKIIIADKEKLKEIINKDPEAIIELLIGKSESVPSYSRDLTAEQRKTRNEEQGIFSRMSDILNDYTTTMRDKNGRKGILIEKAGTTGDSSVSKNNIYEKVEEQNKSIKEMERKMAAKQKRLYIQFATLEKNMNSLNSQSNYLMQQMGMGQ